MCRQRDESGPATRDSGVERIALPSALRDGLRELQENRCFYCSDRLQTQARLLPEVDRFIPWARYPDNAIENLVIAHKRCNGWKRDFLAGAVHLENWSARLAGNNHATLMQLRADTSWESRRDGMTGVTAGICMDLPADARLWTAGKDFERIDRDRVQAAIASLGPAPT